MSPKIGPASCRKGKLWDKWVFGTTSCFKTLTDYGFSYIKSKQNLSRIWGFTIPHALFTIHYHWSVDGLNLNLGAKCFLTGNIQNHPKPIPTKKSCWSVTSINQTSRNMFHMFQIFFITSGFVKIWQEKNFVIGISGLFFWSDIDITPHFFHHTFRHEDRWIGKHFLQLFDMCLKCFWCCGMLFWCEKGWLLLNLLGRSKTHVAFWTS